MPVVPIPASRQRARGFYSIRQFWLRNAWRNARRETARQRGEHPMAVVMAALSPVVAIVLVAALAPGALSSYLQAAAITGVTWLIIAFTWFASNLAAAPHRMWREAGETLQNIVIISLQLQGEDAQSVIYQARLRLAYSQPIDDLAIKFDEIEGAVAALLVRRPDDLADFQRPVALEEVSTDRNGRFLAHMETKKARIDRIVLALQKEFASE